MQLTKLKKVDMQHTQNLFTKIILMFAAAFSVAVMASAPVHAVEIPDLQKNLKQGTCLSTDATACPDTDPNESINSIIATVINLFSLVVGVVAVIMIIIGGLKYITSGGDSGNVTGAKNTILYAVIGLVVVSLAQIIVRFVLERATA
jgi:hypothetical protein